MTEKNTPETDTFQTTPSPTLFKPTRREFLKLAATSAAAIGFPTILPSSVFGSNAPSNRVVMAGIGVGSMGSSNMGNFLREGVQWVAVCDVDRHNLAKAKRRVDKHYDNHDCATYGDLRDLLARSDIDAVSIATPDHWHGWAAVHAARRGFDIYGEKPLAHDIREARAVVNTVKQYGRIWQTGSWQRSRPDFQHAVELVRNGRIGKISHVEIGLPDGEAGKPAPTMPVPEGLDWDMWLGPAPWQPYRGTAHWDWRWVLDWGGGQLNDWIGHHCDIALWALDMEHTGPTEVTAVGTFPQVGFWDAPLDYKVDCTFANGMTMTIANESQLELGMGTRWFGEDGKWIHINRATHSSNPPELWDSLIEPGEFRVNRGTSHQEDFLESVRTRKQTIAPAEPALRAMSVGSLGLISMRLGGRKLLWNPETEQITNDPIANNMVGRAQREPWSLV